MRLWRATPSTRHRMLIYYGHDIETLHRSGYVRGRVVDAPALGVQGIANCSVKVIMPAVILRLPLLAVTSVVSSPPELGWQ